MGVYDDKRGRYRYRFWWKGVLHEQAGFPTKFKAREAEWRERERLGATGKDRRRRPGVPLREAVDAYLESVVKGHKNEESERHSFALVKGQLGERPVDQVTSTDIEAYKLWRAGSKLKNGQLVKGATVNRDLAYLSAFYTWAQRHPTPDRAYVPEGYNPASAKLVKRFEEPWRAWIVLTPEKEAELFAALPPRQRVKAQLLKHMGVRRGIVLGLEWERVDWENRLVQYRQKRKDKVHPVNATAWAILRELWDAQGKPTTGRVFPERSLSSFKRAWRRARVAVGLPELRRHDLRVTFARQLASKGADLKTIQGLLGHSSLTMTSRYIPPDLQAQRRAVEMLDG